MTWRLGETALEEVVFPAEVASSRCKPADAERHFVRQITMVAADSGALRLSGLDCDALVTVDRRTANACATTASGEPPLYQPGSELDFETWYATETETIVAGRRGRAYRVVEP